MGISYRDRLAAIVASPSSLRLDHAIDTKVLAMANEADRAALRIVAGAAAGPEIEAASKAPAGTVTAADRVVAVLALIWLRDPAAHRLLAAVLADPACEQLAASRLPDLAEVPEVVDECRAALEPWLVARLGHADEQLTRNAGWACGRLRVVAAGPRLLELAREAEPVAYRRQWPRDSEHYLAQAARCWPSGEVVDEIRARLGAGPDQRPPSRPAEAAAEIAANAPVDYEWALRWCADTLVSGAQDQGMLAALAARAPGSIPLLDEVIRHAPGDDGPGAALEVMARVDPATAGRYARERWRRFPPYALRVLGRVYRGTADPAVVELVAAIAAERPAERVRCADALLLVGGGEALAAAGRLVSSLPGRASGRRDVERRLERKLARVVAR